MANLRKNGKTRAIVPFWTRMPNFFLYPFYPAILLRILLFSAIAISGLFLGGMGLAFILTLGLAWIFMLRYASRVLVETAFGRLRPHDWGFESPEKLAYMPFKIVLMFSLYGAILGLAVIFLGEIGMILANLGSTFVMPAAMIALVIGGSLLGSLNPTGIRDIMCAIGKPYLLLCLFLFCLSTSNVFLTTKLGESANEPLLEHREKIEQLYQKHDGKPTEEAIREMAQIQQESQKHQSRFSFLFFFSQAVSMYFLIISFNMMGYVTYQYHGALGLKADDDDKPEEEGQARIIARLLEQGEVNEALEVAYEAQRLDPLNPEVMEPYNKLLHLAGKDERLINHTSKLIPLMIEKGMADRALEALRRCRERKADFVPSPSDLLAIARVARQRREPKRALKLLNGFERKFPGHALIPEVYFFCGNILCEDLRQDSLAMSFFQTLCTRYPQHERVADAQRLITMLQNLNKAQP